MKNQVLKATSLAIVVCLCMTLLCSYVNAEQATGNIEQDQWTLGNASVNNGIMAADQAWSSAVYNRTFDDYEANFITTGGVRFIISGTNIWTDRMYVELDFGGAIFLRDISDNTLASAECDFTSGQANSIKIIKRESSLSISVNGTEKLKYQEMSVSSGLVGFIFPIQGTNISSFSISDLGTIVSSEWQDTNATINNGTIYPQAQWNYAQYCCNKEDFDITARIIGGIRFAFGGSNIWTDRYYIEFDMGGAVILRDNSDNNLAAENFAFSDGQYYTTEIINNKGIITVSVNGQEVINYSKVVVQSGPMAFIFTNSNTRVNKFSLIESGTLLQNDWTLTGADMNNGIVTSLNSWTSAVYNKDAKSCTVSAEITGSQRFVFSAENMWLNRYYIEFDFGGAIILRNLEEQNLKVVEYPFIQGQYYYVKIYIYNDGVKLIVNDTEVLNYSDMQIKSGKIGFVFTTQGSKVKQFTYVVRGDANNNGDVDITDLLRLKKYLAGVTQDISQDALKLFGDDIIDSNDIVSLKKELFHIN